MSGGQKRKVGARCDNPSLEEMNTKKFKSSNDQKPDGRGAKSQTQDEPVETKMFVQEERNSQGNSEKMFTSQKSSYVLNRLF